MLVLNLHHFSIKPTLPSNRAPGSWQVAQFQNECNHFSLGANYAYPGRLNRISYITTNYGVFLVSKLNDLGTECNLMCPTNRISNRVQSVMSFRMSSPSYITCDSREQASFIPNHTGYSAASLRPLFLRASISFKRLFSRDYMLRCAE